MRDLRGNVLLNLSSSVATKYKNLPLKIVMFIIYYHFLTDLSDEHWDEIEKAWAQPGQNE